MHTTSHRLLRSAGALTAATIILAPEARPATNDSDAFPAFDSYIKVTGQAAFIHGNGAAYQARAGHDENFGAGIEDFYHSQDLDKTSTLTLDGKALTGTEDYLLHLKLEKIDLGHLDFGYKRFRTFYDGVGGFFPQNSAWAPVGQVYPGIDEDMHVDRGRFWAEAKFLRENQPELTVRYVNETRSGLKDSTIWGDTDNTGQAYGTLNGGLTGANGNASVRKYIPAYLDLDERHQSLEGIVKHTVGNTTAQISLLGDWTSKDNDRYVTRFPGETRAPNASGSGVTPATGTAATSWATFNNQVVSSTNDAQDTDTAGVTATTRTELTDKLTLRVGASYQDVSADFSGDRVLVTNQPITGDPTRTITTYQVKDLAGESTVDAFAGNVGLDYQATETLLASFTLRGEDRSAESEGAYQVVTSTTGAAPVATTTPRREASDTDERSLTPVIDLRYSGIKDLALFTSASRTFGTGTQILTPAYNNVTVVHPNVYHNDITEDSGDYSVGANWRVNSALTLRGEPFFRDGTHHSKGFNTNSSTTATPATPTRGNNYQLDSRFWGVKLGAVVKPLHTLTFTTRYIWQKGERQVTGFLPLYPEYDSMESTTHTIGETIDWNPIRQFYMQASVNLVFNEMSTAYRHDYSTAAAGVIPANRIIKTADSDYLTFSLMAGAAITRNDDLEIRFTAYQAENYDSDMGLYTQPYGASATETTVTVGINHKFSKKLMGSAKVGYFESENDTTGGYTDFHGPLAYLALTYEL